MQHISYTISPLLQQTLNEIELLRRAIVLHPLSPKLEHKLRWEAQVERLYYTQFLAHTPVNRKEVATILSHTGRWKTIRGADAVLAYKCAYDAITYDWLVSQKPIMPQTLASIYRAVTGEKLPVQEQSLMEMLVFLQTSQENPFVQAFVSYLQFINLVPESDNSRKVARLIPYIFLYKFGFDFRGLLVLESYFYTNERLLRELEQVIRRKESITPWLEHFIGEIAGIVGEIQKKLVEEHSLTTAGSFWELTERQKEILSAFDQPGMRITNKRVQQLFTISQITASRDLARLAQLGFLLPQGKGRSVYYMKV
jgi:hypothetical protein